MEQTTVTMADMIAGIIVEPFFGIGLAIIIFLAPLWLKKTKSTSQIQVIVTTAGMFGTFLGIIAGIFLLDVKALDSSIPKLLGGLTTAFLTSIAGLAASLIIQIKPEGFPYHLTEETKAEEKSQEELLSEVLNEMKSLNKNISGEGDTSLTTQIIKMRQDNNDNHKDLKRSFDEFAKQMAENNIKSLVEAVNKVMEDFNAKINDQLGKSFKELSDSVTSLVEWQEQYKQQITDSTVALQESNKSLGVSVESISVLTERAQEFNRTAQELKEALEVMGMSMQGIKSLSEELSGSGENIRKEMKDIVEGSIKNMQNKNNEVVRNFEEINMKTLTAFGSNLASISARLTEDFKKVQEALSLK